MKVRITKLPAMLALALIAGIATPAMAAPPADPVSRMFTWWNAAFRQPDGFTAAAFRQYFTEDATLTINGDAVIHGIPEWVSHFRKIQAGGREVEIVVPFKDVFTAGDRVFTYHVIRSRGGGTVSCMLAAGDAVLRDGKIASIMLVRAPLDATDRTKEPTCWRE